MKVKERANWHVKAVCRKYRQDISLWQALGLEEEFYALFQPYETLEREHNLLLNEGINAMWTLICGGSATAYNNTNARIGVGNSATAAAATQTGLQGASTAFKAMDTSYPTYGTSQYAIFKSSFGDSEANFAWEEWTIDNGATANLNMNRKVESLGTKTSGTWSLQVTITLS
jgi:hypothetical protein